MKTKQNIALCKIDPIKGSETLLQQVNDLEELLKHAQAISVQKRNQFFHELESAQQLLKELRKAAHVLNVFTQAQINHNLEGLEEKIITLYGRIDHCWIDSEVSLIQEEAKNLSTVLHHPVKENFKNISRKVNSLKRHITSLCHDNRLLKKDRAVIALAQQTIKKAQALMEGKTFINQWNLLEIQDFFTNEIEEYDEMETDICELFDIADLFYQNDSKLALRKYNELSSYPKSRVQAHLRQLQVDTLDVSVDHLKMIQALIATAHELCQAFDEEVYWTQEAIDLTFGQELRRLKAQSAQEA